jgi:hypothetical protein
MTMTIEQELAALKAENANLKAAITAKAAGRISYKVSEKGAMSIYGLGKFPFTFYRSQWEAFIAALPATQAFFDANLDLFTVKD